MPPKLDAEPPSKRRRIAVAALGTAGVLLIAAALVGRAAGVRADEAAMDELAARVDASADREEFSPTPEESAVATDDDPSADGPGASVLGATTLPPDPSSPRAQTGSGEAVTFLFGGDVHLDGPLATTLRDHPERILDGLQPALSVADVSIVNLETAVTERGTAAPKAFNFRAPASIYSVLSDGGVDVIASSGEEELWPLVPGTRRFDFPAGTRFSVIGLSDIAGLTLDGVRWPLDEATIPFGSSRTLSNIVTGTLSVNMTLGKAFILAHPAAAQ